MKDLIKKNYSTETIEQLKDTQSVFYINKHVPTDIWLCTDNVQDYDNAYTGLNDKLIQAIKENNYSINVVANKLKIEDKDILKSITNKGDILDKYYLTVFPEEF